MVLIDYQDPFGKPSAASGTLREPPSHLGRAHTIFITKIDGSTQELRKRIQKINSKAGIIECVHHPLFFEDLFTGEQLPLSTSSIVDWQPSVASLSPRVLSRALFGWGIKLSIKDGLPITIATLSRKCWM